MPILKQRFCWGKGIVPRAANFRELGKCRCYPYYRKSDDWNCSSVISQGHRNISYESVL